MRTPSTPLARMLARMDALVDWERADRGAMRVGLEPVRDLLRRLGQPQRAFPAVHVAGSKGKGSVAALVAEGLRLAGFRVGTYGSPHVERPNERVRLDGEEISDDALAEALERALDARDAAGEEGAPAGAATWFDLITGAALWHFAREEVDWAVVECGLGGRLDSTNVLDSRLCIITTIELEHTAFLGDTHAEIAREKAGILRPRVPLVTAPDLQADAAAVIDAVARCLDVKVLRPRNMPTSPRPRDVRRRNLALSRTALDQLGRLPEGHGVRGSLLDDAAVARAQLPGRMEQRTWKGIPVWLDGAHTEASLGALLDELDDGGWFQRAPEVVLALGRDKRHAALLKALARRVDTATCSSVNTGPLLPAEELAEKARSAGLEVTVEPDPEQAIQEALKSADGRWVLILGSLYLVGVARAELERG